MPPQSAMWPEHGPHALLISYDQGGVVTFFAADLYPMVRGGKVAQAPYSLIACHRQPQVPAPAVAL